MPVYCYRAKSPEQSCEYCSHSFETLQSIKDDALTACPKCGSPVEKQLYAVGIAAPHTNAELKNLGFKKLVKRDDGVYENVTRSDKEARYMERGKAETMPDVGSVISD